MINKLMSPKGDQQPFIWFAEYENKEILTEFEDSGKENQFNAIDKARTKEFGLIGRGLKLSFDTDTGEFAILNKKINFKFIKDGKDVNLTHQLAKYNDLITYKSAFTDYDPSGKTLGSCIDAYFFGYKGEIVIDGILCHMKVIFGLPVGGQIKFSITLSPKEAINGEIRISIDGVEPQGIMANFKANEGQEFSWSFQ